MSDSIGTETIISLQELSKALEKATKDKLSTNELTPERLLWEIYNKIFTILITCENCITSKDSLTAHLIARYTYELLIIFAYIFQDKTARLERAKKFLEFNQFQTLERKWTKVEYKQMIEALPDGSRFSIHSDHYRRLSNFAHPTMDSFMLNRRGNEIELRMIVNTVLLTLSTILEIIKICIEDKLYFDPTQEEELLKEMKRIYDKTDNLMKNTGTSRKTYKTVQGTP